MFGNVVYIPSTNEAGGEVSILEKDGINTTSNKSHDLGNNTLSLNNGQFHLINSFLGLSGMFQAQAHQANLPSVFALLGYNGDFIANFNGNGTFTLGSGLGEETAILDMASTNDKGKGVLLPEMTLSERDLIPNPAKNLLVRVTDRNDVVYRYDGAKWVHDNGYGLFAIYEAGVPKFYSSFNEALNDNLPNQVIHLFSNCVVDSNTFWEIDRPVIINGNGFKLTGDTSLGDFPLIKFNSNLYSSDGNSVIINDLRVNSSGTIVNDADASAIHCVSLANTYKLNLNNSFVVSENAYAIYSNGLNGLDGGFYTSTNNGAVYLTNSVNAKSEIYRNLTLKGAKGSKLNCNTEFISSHHVNGNLSIGNGYRCSKSVFIGETTEGSTGVLYAEGGTNLEGVYVENINENSNQPALFIRGSGGNGSARAKHCIGISRGGGDGISSVYGDLWNCFGYSENGQGIYSQNSTLGTFNCVSMNNSVNQYSFYAQNNGSKVHHVGNFSFCLNSSNSKSPFFISSTNAAGKVYFVENKAILYNGSVPHVKLGSNSGSYYLVKNTYFEDGTGVDLNGNVNSQSNTEDSYGNIQIG